MENLIEELTKVNPANLSEEGLKLFNKINEIIDENRELEGKYNQLFEEYNKRVATIINYEQGIKTFLDDTNITDIEPWSIYKIKGQLLFDLQELLEERN